MPEYLSPGVYVEEVDTGNKPIEGVSTSTAGMVGVTERGPVAVPILVTSVGEYARWFGQTLNAGDFPAHSFLPHAVQGFFDNRGSRLYVTRIVSQGATSASRFMFDRGTPTSVATTLLRSASQNTGTMAAQPVLYVLDTTGINPNDWVRVGDGSAAEYRQVAATGGAVGTMTHLTVNFPVSFAHAGINVDQLARAPAAGAGVNFTLALDAPRGSTIIQLQGTAADIIALLAAVAAAPKPVLEVGSVAGGEHHFATAATTIGTTQARITLASPLAMLHAGGPAGEAVTRLDLTAAAPLQSSALDVPIMAEDRLIFVAAGPATPNALAVLGLPAAPQREVRRIGALAELSLLSPAHEPYVAGSLLEEVALADSALTLQAATAANATQIVLNDPAHLFTNLSPGETAHLLPGQALNVDGETATIASIDTATRQVTFTGPLANLHANNANVFPLTTTRAATLPGATVIWLANRLGLTAGDVLHIGVAPEDEFVVIEAMRNRAPEGVVPDPGNIVLTYPLSQSHAAGTQVVRVVPPTVTATQPTVTVLDAALGATTILVTDGTGYVGGQGIRLTTTAGGVFYHLLGAATAPVAGALSLTAALENAHPIGSIITARNKLFDIQALDLGGWGNRLRISVVDEVPGLVSNTTISTIIDPSHIRLASAAGVEAGTILELLDPPTDTLIDPPLKVTSVNRASNFTITLDSPLTASQMAAETAAVASGTHLNVGSREFRLTVYLLHQTDAALPSRGDIVIDSEVFRWLSMDPRHSRYIETIIGAINGPLRKSDRRPEGESWYVRVQDQGSNQAVLESPRYGPETLVDVLPNRLVRPARHPLEGGDDSIGTMGDADYIGADAADPENRTGAADAAQHRRDQHRRLSRADSPVVQQALIDHCELMRYRFAVLDAPAPPDDAHRATCRRSASSSTPSTPRSITPG